MQGKGTEGKDSKGKGTEGTDSKGKGTEGKDSKGTGIGAAIWFSVCHCVIYVFGILKDLLCLALCC